MRDTDTIDSELGLLVAIRHMVREAEGRPPSTAYIDGLPDERAAVLAGANRGRNLEVPAPVGASRYLRQQTDV